MDGGSQLLSRPATAPPQPARVTGFRTRLLLAMMLVVSAITALALYFAQRGLAATVERDLKRDFEAQLAAMDRSQEVRRAALLERCRALVRKPRIRAALEDDALDLLYDNAENELADMMRPPDEAAADAISSALQAQFYRFLDHRGSVIKPASTRAVGSLSAAAEAQLSLPGVPDRQQSGYVARGEGADTLSEIIAMPIASTETGEPIAALVVGFKPFEPGGGGGSDMKTGIWFNGRLYSAALDPGSAAGLTAELARRDGDPAAVDRRLRIQVDGTPHLLFAKRLNPDSHFPPAEEVCLYPLSGLLARQRQLGWQVIGAGTLLLLVGLGASHVVSSRLSAPVEKLAVDSEEHRTRRERAEAALELTSAELQRAARFSADASHQLKTPVTVLRAGLEELLAREQLTPEECDQVSALIHQTYRLSSVIEDLLLLSRMDAGRLKIEFLPVDLTHLIEASLDDLGALPAAEDLAIETEFPPELHVLGEKRYTAIILQNLFENARKYNRPGGRVRIAAWRADDAVLLQVANTGRPIPAAAQAHIFERFHRAAVGEDVPGYGLGLNLARELARLHQGELRLVRSAEGWTVFELRLRAARR
jgi:signal transduction histidine kinase